jgi:protein SCO1
MSRGRKWFWVFSWICAGMISFALARASEIPVSTLKDSKVTQDPSEVVPKEFQNVTVVEKLGSQVDLSLAFQDEAGLPVTLADFVKDGKPLLLTLNYYSCSTLCSLQLTGFAEAVKNVDPKHRAELRIVTVSFDPRDTPESAQVKRRAMEAALGSGKTDWSFLTGSEKNVKALASSLGFQYRYDERTDQFAHTAAVYFLSPKGVISRYLYGITFSPRDLRFAWIEASEGRYGSTVEKVLLTCFHYDASTGEYTPFAFRMVRIGGLVTLSCLGILLGALWRKEKRRLAGGWESAV